MKIKSLPCLMLLVSLLCLRAGAQNYSIDWFKVAGGGSTSTGGVYSISGTIGQHDANATLTGGNYSLTGGFEMTFATPVGIVPGRLFRVSQP